VHVVESTHLRTQLKQCLPSATTDFEDWFSFTRREHFQT